MQTPSYTLLIFGLERSFQFYLTSSVISLRSLHITGPFPTEGLCLAAEWIQGPAVLESDCSTVIEYLTNPRLQRPRTIFTIQEATKAAARLPSVIFKHIRRGAKPGSARIGATG